MARHFLLVLLFLLVVVKESYAKSVSVSPDALEFLVAGRSDEKQIIIFNGNDAAANFSVSAEGFDDWFSFDKENVKVNPGSYEKVKVSVKPEEENGNYVTSIKVAPLSENGKNVNVQLSASVKALIRIERKASILLGTLVTGLIVSFGLLSYLAFRQSAYRRFLR